MPRTTDVLVKNRQPRETFVAPRPRRENEVPTKKKKEKQHQREILKSRDTRQIHSKRRVDVDCQNRDSLKEDVCSCLACPKTFPRFLTIQEETRRCHSYFTRMTSRTSSESVSSCNRVSNATGFCQWIFVVHLIIIEQGCASCFPTFAGLKRRIEGTFPQFLDQERFHHRTSGISRLGQTVCQHRQSVDPVNTSIGDSALFLDASCFLHLCESFAIEAVVIHFSSRHRKYLENL